MISASQPPGSPAINALVKGSKNTHHLAIRAHRLLLFAPSSSSSFLGRALSWNCYLTLCLSSSGSHWPQAQMPAPKARTNLRWVPNAERPVPKRRRRSGCGSAAGFCRRSCFWPQKGLESGDEISSSLDGSSGCRRFHHFSDINDVVISLFAATMAA